MRANIFLTVPTDVEFAKKSKEALVEACTLDRLELENAHRPGQKLSHVRCQPNERSGSSKKQGEMEVLREEPLAYTQEQPCSACTRHMLPPMAKATTILWNATYMHLLF